MLQHYRENQPNQNPLILQQIAYEFRHEVRSRTDFEAHCQWYYTQAAKHQAELAAMENDLPIFSWFHRRKS